MTRISSSKQSLKNDEKFSSSAVKGLRKRNKAKIILQVVLGVEVRNGHREACDSGLLSYILFPVEIEDNDKSFSSCTLPAALLHSDKLLTVLNNYYILNVNTGI